MPTTRAILITWKAIQDELKLTRTQVGQIETVNADFDRRRREFAQGQTKPQGRLAPAALSEWITSVRMEQEAAIARILNPQQKTRLDQIALQIEGPVCLARPEIAERVGLGPEQLELVQEIVAQMRTAQDQQWNSRLESINTAGPAAPALPKADSPGSKDTTQPPDPVEKAHQEQVQIQDQAVRQIAKVLTRRQRGALNRLMGKPFDLTRLLPGRTQPSRDIPLDAPEVLEPVENTAGGVPSPAPGRNQPSPRQ
jgi:Spy/CpxP family protein refolding chaperone